RGRIPDTWKGAESIPVFRKRKKKKGDASCPVIALSVCWIISQKYLLGRYLTNCWVGRLAKRYSRPYRQNFCPRQVPLIRYLGFQYCTGSRSSSNV
ncbi:hypothetical protein NDU88_008038, partial [Pleurodeles waltl]